MKIEFAAFGAPASVRAGRKSKPGQTLVVFAGAEFAFGKQTVARLGAAGAAVVKRAAAVADFKGRSMSALDILAPADIEADRLLVIGTGQGAKPAAETKEPPAALDCALLGGYLLGKLGRNAAATVLVDFAESPADAPAAAADLALGLKLRHYRFDRYKTRKRDDAPDEGSVEVTLVVADPAAAKKAAIANNALAEGIITARTLVNEPANILYPEEVARRVQELEKLGVEVTILDEAQMQKLGMRALLGVGQGSARASRTVIMRWRGSKSKAKPVAFIGKGVCFDTGGISIKPAGGMEDMKGDMAGAACVIGLMQALAGRKAKVDAIGAIGLVENMPGPNAQRPGDIVTSMSGQTIEVINTDAEGRLVLADVLWYVQDKYKPRFMVDLATLTGAILVALGAENAGLFSNDDTLSDHLIAVGKETGEKVWRMPLGPAYDKMIDSKFADMKNTGGRHGGSITAAQFLQRFVNGTPWAHLDIAGTGMNSPSSEINQSWGSGWGVRLLDRLVAEHYEG